MSKLKLIVGNAESFADTTNNTDVSESCPTNTDEIPGSLLQLIKKSEKNIHEKTINSKLFVQKDRVITKVPKFHESELTLGRVLGRGGFCVVNEITNITLNKHFVKKELAPVNEGNCDDGLFIQDRNFMAEQCLRCSIIKDDEGSSKKKMKNINAEKNCRYAIKKIQDSCFKDYGQLLMATMDLAIEAQFLACLAPHPNIIKMRAMSNCSSMSDCKRFFVVLDRLYDTLAQRLVKWKKTKQSQLGIMNKLIIDRKGKKVQQFWIERCTFACDLADAIKFLHASNVMYRDLKPENIGFDVRGDIKLFDFGLAKEFDPNQRDSLGCFHLTADTGSPRYMDPQVALGKPYNERCDVYSFCVLLWQMLELETPYKGYSMNMFYKHVVNGNHRPAVNKEWSTHIKELMWLAFDADYTRRPSMEDVFEALQKECDRDDEENVGRLERSKSRLSMNSLGFRNSGASSFRKSNNRGSASSWSLSGQVSNVGSFKMEPENQEGTMSQKNGLGIRLEA